MPKWLKITLISIGVLILVFITLLIIKPPDNSLCGDGICGPLEQSNPNLCPKDCANTSTETTSLSTSTITQNGALNYSTDADGTIWGTETDSIFRNTGDTSLYINTINNTLHLKNVKIRLADFMVQSDGSQFQPRISGCSSDACNLDKLAETFKSNGWSMAPMLTADGRTTLTQTTLDKYVNFVDWFVSRYKTTANIKRVELVNAPFQSWKGTAKQLVEAQNKIYDKLKNKYPDLEIGTPGFEFFIDGSNSPLEKKMTEYVDYFLDKNNGAKFDFFAFHGYPLSVPAGNGTFYSYPPTKIATKYQYGGIYGIKKIREKMDANGWQNRKIMDTEHLGTNITGSFAVSELDDKLNSAYTAQELLLKKTLSQNGKLVLSGISTLKINKRGGFGEGAEGWGSLQPNGSILKSVNAVAIFLGKINSFKYNSHLSGEFDNEKTAWVEKFTNGNNKELYIIFKPFKFVSGKNIAIDNESINYTLNFNRLPKKITKTDIYGNASALNTSIIAEFKATNEVIYIEAEY